MHQRLLHRKQRPLGVERIQVAGHTVVIAQPCQPKSHRFRVDLRLAGAQLRHQRGPRGQRIRHFPKSHLNGFFILRHGNALLHFGRVQPRLVAARIKNGGQQLGRKAPGKGAAVKQLYQLVTGGSCLQRQRYFREESGTRRADVGV